MEDDLNCLGKWKATSIFRQLEDDLNYFWKMEDDFNFLLNQRQANFLLTK